MPTRALLVLLSIGLCAACSAPAQAMDPQVHAQLVAAVTRVRVAATLHNRAAAEVALRTLDTEVSAARAEGRLDPAYAGAILAAGDRVADDVATFSSPQPTVTTTTPRETPRSRIEQTKQREKHGKGS